MYSTMIIGLLLVVYGGISILSVSKREDKNWKIIYQVLTSIIWLGIAIVKFSSLRFTKLHIFDYIYIFFILALIIASVYRAIKLIKDEDIYE